MRNSTWTDGELNEEEREAAHAKSEPKEEESIGEAYDASLMKRLLEYLRPYQWPVALAILILLAASLLQVVGPWLTQIAIDDVIPNRDASLLAALAGAYLATTVAGAARLHGHAVPPPRVAFIIKKKNSCHLWAPLGLPAKPSAAQKRPKKENTGTVWRRGAAEDPEKSTFWGGSETGLKK